MRESRSLKMPGKPVPCVLCRYSEIGLKGKNRDFFENILIQNIRRCFQRNKVSFHDIKKIRGRIIIYTDSEKALLFLTQVFGLSSVSPAFEIRSGPSIISSFVEHYASRNISQETKTFRISVNRPNKKFPLKSNELEVSLGSLISENLSLKVDLKNPDFNLNVEIHENVFVFHEKVPCLGGLPVSVSGKVPCLVNRPEDVVLPWLLMKRGCSVVVLSPLDKEELSVLSSYDCGSPFIHKKTENAEITVKDINDALLSCSCRVFAVPDTLEYFNPGKYQGIGCALLTPLVGFSEEGIQKLFRRISDV